MGWVSSPLLAREMIGKIMYDHLDYTMLYMDDIFIWADSAEALLDRVDKVFHTLTYRNLRLKGSKDIFFSKDITLLGRRIKNGRICASNHIMDKAVAESVESIVTIKQLKRFLGIVNYLSIGLPRRTELMHDLNVAASAGNELSERVKWTPELEKTFRTLTKALNSQMLELFPIEKGLPTFIVVDSSNLGSGGYLYQKNGSKVQINRLWSKKRGDAGHKTQ